MLLVLVKVMMSVWVVDGVSLGSFWGVRGGVAQGGLKCLRRVVGRSPAQDEPR